MTNNELLLHHALVADYYDYCQIFYGETLGIIKDYKNDTLEILG